MRINDSQKKSIVLILIIVLTGTGSFGLGRLSVMEKERGEERAAIIMPKLRELSVDESQFSFVASKNGTKYYTIGCKSADRIKEENKIYFETVEEARETGLEPASGC